MLVVHGDAVLAGEFPPVLAELVDEAAAVAGGERQAIYLRIPEPRPANVAPWEDLPSWQQETDADMFDAIERATRPDSLRAAG